MKATPEQQQAIDLFQTRKSLKIEAYAGTGKTTTLTLLARSTPRSGQYVAFNRAIAEAAKSKFPATVNCRTQHSLAYSAVRSKYGYGDSKMKDKANANLIASVMNLPEYTRFQVRDLTLSSQTYGAVLRDACRNFMLSADPAPAAKHFPRYGLLAILTKEEFSAFASQALPKVREMWALMRDRNSGLPLGHDGYVKVWALDSPKIPAEYILLDEAQDTNEVVLAVLRNQAAQLVLVGDPYQQIYDWRGAINAMQKMATDNVAALTQSFRFGEHIANAAGKVIATIGATKMLRGCESHVASVHPRTIICRTNAGVIDHILRWQARGNRCHVVNGTSEQERLLKGVERLQRNIPSELPEFFGFKNWSEVVAYSAMPEGENLRTFVRLVTDHGVHKLLGALRNVEPVEHAADIVVSTAHRAKGCEWPTVLVDRDFEASFLKPSEGKPKITTDALQSETRLFYVAMTRAIDGVELPPNVMAHFDISNTHSGTIGTPPRRAPRSAAASAGVSAASAASPFRATSSTTDVGFLGALKKFFS